MMTLSSGGILSIDTINELTGAAGVTIEGVLLKDSDVTIPTANYLYLNVGGTTHIYDNAGVLTLTDAGTGAKALSDFLYGKGTSNQIPHMNTGGTDFDYDANFTYDGVGLNIDAVTGAILRVYKNTTLGMTISNQGAGDDYALTAANGALFLYSLEADPAIIIGTAEDTSSYLTIRDTDAATPRTNSLNVVDVSAASLFSIQEAGPIYMPQLGSDDAEMLKIM
jgi:hypothetical protein